jgi:D-alanyl-D-alanine endopeptidase (penicillin-binding protein 7)
MNKIILALFLLLPVFAFSATTKVMYDVTNNRVVGGSLDHDELSIASISKLMTVYTVLKENQDLNEKLTVTGKITPNTKLVKGMVLSRLDLINLALVGSDNLAAQTLAENFVYGYSYFINRMNQHTVELNMLNTRFVEPTGLSPMNYSSINDIILLTKAVYDFDIVKDAAKVKSVTAYTTKGKKQLKITSNSTSTFFGREGIVTIKTGFTKAAGFCITLLVASNNQLYNITVLGAKTSKERQIIVEKFLNTIYSA